MIRLFSPSLLDAIVVTVLSVVTITFNDSAGLLRTRNSLPTTRIKWYVIDGSDNLNELRKNKRILSGVKCTLIQEPDTGRFNAMNKGLNLVNSELVTFLNSGDIWVNKRVALKITKSFEALKWQWVVGQTICVDRDGREQWKWPIPNHNSLKFLLSVRSFPHQATVYKTSFIKDMGGYYEDSIYSDWILSLKLSKNTPPVISKEVWCYFLEGGISGMQTVNFWRKECVRLRQIANLCIKNSKVIDWLLQLLAATSIKIDRGKFLMRPDLAVKYRDREES